VSGEDGRRCLRGNLVSSGGVTRQARTLSCIESSDGSSSGISRVSHTQLLLREWRDGEHYASLHVLFTDVVAVYVKQTDASMLVRRASTEEIAKIRATSGIEVPWLQHYVLGDHLNDGRVQCGAVLVAEDRLDLMHVPLLPPRASPMPFGWRPLDNLVALAVDPPEEDLFSSQEEDVALHPPQPPASYYGDRQIADRVMRRRCRRRGVLGSSC
jgi:hypothetical protein